MTSVTIKPPIQAHGDTSRQKVATLVSSNHYGCTPNRRGTRPTRLIVWMTVAMIGLIGCQRRGGDEERFRLRWREPAV
jgi:hypothetical protein